MMRPRVEKSASTGGGSCASNSNSGGGGGSGGDGAGAKITAGSSADDVFVGYTAKDVGQPCSVDGIGCPGKIKFVGWGHKSGKPVTSWHFLMF
jgi:hypothetical protein